MQLPDGDQTSMSRKQMLARLVVCMGGRVAEEAVFGQDNVTSGASNDIQQATKLAKAMVMTYGFSERLGVVHINDKEKLSDDVQRVVDEEVQALLTDSYNKAKALVEAHRKDLDSIALALIEYESLSGSEIIDVMNGRKINAALRSQKPSREMQPIDTKTQPVRRATAVVPSAADKASASK
jgi:ATP-dependent metalloprotease